MIPLRIALLALSIVPWSVLAAKDEDPEDVPFAGSAGWQGDHEKRLKWFRDARFGMFIHLGLYSAAGGYWPPDPAVGKLYEKNDSIDLRTWASIDEPEYGDKLKPLFRPEPGCTDEWARLAAEAGMRYAVFTAKGPEGYTLFNSSQSYSLDNPVTHTTNISPPGRDLFREFVTSFRREGITPGVYYSLVDWQYPDAQAYRDYLHGQLRELGTNYGPLGVLWADYSSSGKEGSYWGCRSILDAWRVDQPDSLVNNRFWGGFENSNGDFFTPEGYVPPGPYPGFIFEVSLPLNNGYGFHYGDKKGKPPRDVLLTLSDVASRGGNLLLNIAPDSRGHIPSTATETLESVGRWLGIHGAAIFDTEPNPFKSMPFKGTCTVGMVDGKYVLYCHLHAWPPGGVLPLSGLMTECKSATLLGTLAIQLDIIGGSFPAIRIPDSSPDPNDLLPVIAVVLDGKPVVDSTTYPRQAADRSFNIPASQAVLSPGPATRYPLRMEEDHIGWWSKSDDSAWFPILMKEPKAPGSDQPGRFRVMLDYAVAPTCGGEVEVRMLDQVLPMKIVPTGSWTDFRVVEAGVVTISQPGLLALHIRPLEIFGYGLMNLRSVRLIPVADAPAPAENLSR
ncbi:MAG: hypothetical protein JWO82_4345 [Akkermansiaceae bacterium]|nr:hypothetical protein [Akkermansiaceae bacterium]